MAKRTTRPFPPGLMGDVSSTALILGAVFGLTTGAAAQTAAPAPAAVTSGPDDIVVTATRRSESIRDVPSSISAVSQAAIEKSGATVASDIVRMVPGLSYTQNSVGQAVLAIRGIQGSAVVGNVQMPVELYYNDVPVLDPYVPWTVPALNLFDVSRVEVLRGPQGTLFGAGALSGAIRVITNKPDMTKFDAATEDTVDTTKGGGVGYDINGMVNIPIIRDKLAVRAVGYYDYTAGWIDNPTLGENRINHATVGGGRVAVEWKPVADLDINLTGSEELTRPHDSNYVPYGEVTDVASNRVRNFNNDTTKIVSLSITYAMPWATLSSSTSYIHRDAFSSLDFSGVAGLYSGSSAVAPLTDQFTTKNFLQEFRLSSSQSHPFKWLIGAFLERYRFNLHEKITQDGVDFPGYAINLLEDVGGTDFQNDVAAFGEASYDIVPTLTFTSGLRYSHYSVGSGHQGALSGTDFFDGPPSSFEQTASYNAVTPKFNLSFKPSNDVMVYGLIDKGFRTGNANLNSATDPITGLPLPTSYKPDTVWNYEVGTKLSLFDRRLRIDLAAFYIDWTGIQLTISAPGSGINYISNAGTASSKGVEATIVGKPIQALEIGTSLTYDDAKLKSISPGVSATVGDRLPGSAPFTAYVYGEYDIPVSATANVSLRVDYSYTGREFSYLNNVGNASAIEYGDYATVGARAGIDFGKYGLTAFVRNLADTRGRVSARKLYPAEVEVLQTPRTIGLTFRAKL